jgi:hypothetical protein
MYFSREPRRKKAIFGGTAVTSTLNIRLPEAEAETLTRYVAGERRTKTDILREFIRSLEPLGARAETRKAVKRKYALA